MEKPRPTPPKWPQRFFQWYCNDSYLEDLEGDLNERFELMCIEKGVKPARRQYFLDVMRLFRPGIIRSILGRSTMNPSDLYRHNLKVGIRNLSRNMGYSTINIGGLAIGMTMALLIGLWVWDEISFNQYHKNYQRIGQVMRSGTLNGETFTFPYLPYALGNELKEKYGDNFKNIAVSSLAGSHVLSNSTNQIARNGLYIDSNGPEMFSFKILNGTKDGLEDVHSIMLSQNTAFELFGDTDPINQVVLFDNDVELQVTAVFENFPRNSFLHETQFFTPWPLYIVQNEWVKDQGFTNNFLNIFVELGDHSEFESASINIKDAILNNVSDNPTVVKVNPQLQLHPMDRWHLYGEWENGNSTAGLIKFVWLFGIVGVFVLLLACVNFMNLSTARSEKRAKEVGVRKAIGSVRWQLVSQFYTESFLLVLVAFCFCLLLASGVLPLFNDLAGKQIFIPLKNINFWIVCLGFILVTSFLAGSYPAIYLSSFRPLKVLKGSFKLGKYSNLPRKVLVVFQFAVSVILVICTAIVFEQVQFVKNRPVGYNRGNLMMVPMTTSDFYSQYDAIETELKASRVVSEVSTSLSPITGVWSTNGGFDWRGMDPGWQQEDFATLAISHSYGNTIGWNLVKGRDFSVDMASDSLGIVINETAAKLMGFDDPIGENVGWSFTGKEYRIIGVVKDMIMDSPFTSPMPTIFYIGNNVNWINIKLGNNNDLQSAIATVDGVFNKLIPAVPFSYRFADEQFAMKFIAEERIGKLLRVFSSLAIFISCLGLIGLASFVAEQRTKEIGIRKILGASTSTLWQLLTKEFLLLITISSIVSTPVAYFAMKGWLNNYEYRTNPDWQIFVAVIFGALFITLLTVGYQAIRAALNNPIHSIKTE